MEKISMVKNFLQQFPWHAIFMLQGKDISVDKENKILWCPNIRIEDIEKYNSPLFRCDIYFTPNGNYDEQEYSKSWSGRKWPWYGRVEKQWKNIYCSAVDIDTEDKVWEWILEPTFIVKTGKWYHIYFLYNEYVDSVFDYKERKDHMNKLYTVLHWDPGCRSNQIQGILRVPYTKYWRDNKWDKEIQRVKNDGPKYDFDNLCEIVEWLYRPMESEKNENKIYKSWWKKSVDLTDEINRLDVGDVLNKISDGKYTAKWTIIYEWDRPTKWYKVNTRENYVLTFSPHDERPVWWPFAVVKKILMDNVEVFNWFEKNYGIKVSEARTEYEDFYKKMKSADWTETKEWQDCLIIGNGRHKVKIDYIKKQMDFIIEKKDWLLSTLFCTGVVEPVWYIYIDADDWSIGKEKRIILKISTKQWEEFTTLLKPMGSSGELKKLLMQYWVMSPGQKEAIDILLQWILGVNTQYNYTERLGLQDIDWKRYFVRQWWTYIKEDMFVNVNDITQEIITEPKYRDKSWKEIVEILLKIYDGSVIYPLMLSTIYIIYIYYRRIQNTQEYKQVPWCFIEWLQGSGKSYIKNLIFRKMFGIKYSMSASSTPFTYLKNAGHYMPINTEDYRNSSLRSIDEVLNILRNAFDGTESQRGNNMLKIRSLKVNGQFVIDWQTKFFDWATVTRQINLMTTPDKKLDKIYAKDLQNCMQNVLDIFKENDDIDKFLKKKSEVIDEYQETFGDKNYHDADRVIQNYSGIIALWRWMWLIDFEPILKDWMVRQLERDEGDDIMSTYSKVFNIYSISKGNIEFTEWGAIIEINLESTRMSDLVKQDLTSMIKTINAHFNKLSIHTDWAYVDFNYVFTKPALWNKFRNAITTAYVPEVYDLDEWKTESIKILKLWFLAHFPKDDFIKDLNYWLQQNNNVRDPSQKNDDIL